MLIVRGIMWISVLIVMLICMVKTKRNGMKKKIRALIFVVFLFILFVFMPYSTEAPIENLFITFKTPEQAIHYINAPFSNDKIEDIIVGQDTCMAVFESGQDEELYAGRDMWLRKGEKGYKLISAAGVQKAIFRKARCKPAKTLFRRMQKNKEQSQGARVPFRKSRQRELVQVSDKGKAAS